MIEKSDSYNSPSKDSILFHSIMKNSKIVAIFIMDENGQILQINPGVVNFFGYKEGDVLGKNFSLLFTKEDQEDEIPIKELRTVIKMGSASDNNYVVHKNGKNVWVHGESVLGKDIYDKIYIIKIIYDLSVQHTLEKTLVNLNNDLNNFVYTASHDLKSPINNIEALLHILEDTFENNEDPKKIIENMKISVNRFKNILEDLSETREKKEQEGKGVISLIQFKEMTEEVIDNLKNSIEKLDAKVRCDFSMASEIYFSKKNLRSIIHNLLSNAVKFSSPDRKPEIFISTEKIDNYILFKIKDNGLGIKESNMNKLFVIYERFNKDIDGSGVGLAIVKRIIDNNGGKIEVESKEGEGSTFLVYFQIKE